MRGIVKIRRYLSQVLSSKRRGVGRRSALSSASPHLSLSLLRRPLTRATRLTPGDNSFMNNYGTGTASPLHGFRRRDSDTRRRRSRICERSPPRPHSSWNVKHRDGEARPLSAGASFLSRDPALHLFIHAYPANPLPLVRATES